MGQKVNPTGLRLKIVKDWESVWYAGKDYGDKLQQDLRIKKLVRKSLSNAGLSKVIVKRSANKKMVLEVYTSRPGVVIGKKGADIEILKKKIEGISGIEVSININEVRKPEIEGQLVADSIAQQLEKRVASRRAAKKAIQTAMRYGAKGIRIKISGRLGGAEIARSESYKEGRVPLHTLRADIDYATSEANTTYGVLGIKVWVYKGDVGIESPVNNKITAVS